MIKFVGTNERKKKKKSNLKLYLEIFLNKKNSLKCTSIIEHFNST